MAERDLQALVLGNVALDILCYPVKDVPRHTSIAFDRVDVGPGGCGSNVALGLSALGVKTALTGRIGEDSAAEILETRWRQAGLDLRYVHRIPGAQTGVSIGLVDQNLQPRFIHTPGASEALCVDDLDLEEAARLGVKALHVAGFFVLPGLLDGRLPGALANARRLGLLTSLDVVESPGMDHPEPLWPCLPFLDIFLCNSFEASRLTGLDDPAQAASLFRSHGARIVIIKMGEMGCRVDREGWIADVPTQSVPVVDTTGAGDAFDAGLLAALLNGVELYKACQKANDAGGRAVSSFGAVTCWI